MTRLFAYQVETIRAVYLIVPLDIQTSIIIRQLIPVEMNKYIEMVRGYHLFQNGVPYGLKEICNWSVLKHAI